MIKLFTLMLFMLVALLQSLPAKALHLVVLADTADPRIGLPINQDVQNIQNCFSYLAELSKLPFHVTTLTTAQKNLTRYHILTNLQRQHFTKDDIVVLYYTGHGMRKKTTETSLPGICVTNEMLGESYVAFDEIVKILINRRVALCIMLVDSCNVLPEIYKESKEYCQTCKFENLDKKVIKKNLKTLVKKPFGFIIASATAPGELGRCLTCHEDVTEHCRLPLIINGSVFTTVFLNQLFEELSTQTPTWTSIFSKTRDACVAITGNPHRYLLTDILIKRYNPPHKHQTPLAKFCIYTHRKTRVHYLKRFVKEFSLYTPESQLSKEAILEISETSLEAGFDASCFKLQLSGH